jgi:23S rRNA (guanine745-N1)-methyltransferase
LQHLAQLTGQGPRAIAEIGCGTGDYIGALARHAELAGVGVCFFGVDISSAALRIAARSHPAVCFLVNDLTHRLCFADAAVDVLLDIFAPRNQIEFSRVLRPGGALLVVVPAEPHLAELRARVPLLAVEPEKPARTAASLSPAFRQVAQQRLEYTISVTAEDLPDLLRMTPSAWHLSEPVFEQIGRAGPLEVTAAFQLLCFRRVT